ncbi:hypothetical protein KIPB_006002, partial [Kipferlia bialata]
HRMAQSDRPVHALTVNLLETYKKVNELYYAEKGWAQQQQSKPRAHDDQNHNLIACPNDILGNRYVVKSFLGRGSFGQVLKCEDKKTGEEVAVKVIKSPQIFLRQGRIELDILHRLRDNDTSDAGRYCIKVLESFMHQDHLCIVTELLSYSLYDLLKSTSHKGVSLKLLRRFGIQILKCLEYIGSEKINIIHCDLKPENVLLRSENTSGVKVIDFGSSCETHQTMYTYIQSRFYRAPEVILRLPYGKAIDIWSLGKYDLVITPTFGDGWLSDDIAAQIATAPDARQVLENEWAQLVEDRTFLRHVFSRDPNRDDYALAVNLTRIIENAKESVVFKADGNLCDVSPVTVAQLVERELNQLKPVRQGPSGFDVAVADDAIRLFKIHCRACLASKRVCTEYCLSINQLHTVLSELTSVYDAALVHPGESVGAIAAQSLGEPATQMTLNTFHMAGYSGKNVTLGVPRLNELLNVSKSIKTPGCTVHVEGGVVALTKGTGREVASKEDSKRAEALVNDIRLQFQQTYMKDLVSEYHIAYDPLDSDTRIEEDKDLLEAYADLGDINDTPGQNPFILRYIIDKPTLHGRNLELTTIMRILNQEFHEGSFAIYGSADTDDTLVLRFRVGATGGEGDADQDDLGAMAYKVMQTLHEDLLSVRITGVEGIASCFLREDTRVFYEDKHDGAIKQTSEWIIDTDGANMQVLMNHPGVDATRVFCNDILAVKETLGIEAARAALQEEIKFVHKNHQIYVNERHLTLLCDSMTHLGVFMPITRHGINKTASGPIKKASFEKTVDEFFLAGAFAEHDVLEGVSERIVFGKVVRNGTGLFDIRLDRSVLEENAQAGEINTNIDEAGALTDGDGGFTPAYRTGGGGDTPGARTGSGYEMPMFSPEDGMGATPGAHTGRGDMSMGAVTGYHGMGGFSGGAFSAAATGRSPGLLPSALGSQSRPYMSFTGAASARSPGVPYAHSANSARSVFGLGMSGGFGSALVQPASAQYSAGLSAGFSQDSNIMSAASPDSMADSYGEQSFWGSDAGTGGAYSAAGSALSEDGAGSASYGDIEDM